MSSTVIIPIPPGPLSVPLNPGQPFKFQASAPCQICFSVNALFQGISGKSFQVQGAQSLGPYIAPGVITEINYSVVAPAEQCHPTIITETAKTIHVGSGGGRKKRAYKKAGHKKAGHEKAGHKKPAHKKRTGKKKK